MRFYAALQLFWFSSNAPTWRKDLLKRAKVDFWWPLVTWPLTWPKNDSSCFVMIFDALSNTAYRLSLCMSQEPSKKGDQTPWVKFQTWVWNFNNMRGKILSTDLPKTVALCTTVFASAPRMRVSVNTLHFGAYREVILYFSFITLLALPTQTTLGRSGDV